MTANGEDQRKSRLIVVEDHPVLCDGLMQLICRQPDLTLHQPNNTSDAKRLVERTEGEKSIEPSSVNERRISRIIWFALTRTVAAGLRNVTRGKIFENFVPQMPYW